MDFFVYALIQIGGGGGGEGGGCLFPDQMQLLLCISQYFSEQRTRVFIDVNVL